MKQLLLNEGNNCASGAELRFTVRSADQNHPLRRLLSFRVYDHLVNLRECQGQITNAMQGSNTAYYAINGITMYRLVSAPFLLLLAITGEHEWFKWLIAFSFFTDAIDGPLSRNYNVTSIFGARLDSVADDATVLVSTIALWIINPFFVMENWMPIAGLLALFGVQTVTALIAYKKVTSFHTYMAKAAAVAQAFFFIIFFFKFPFAHGMFIAATTITTVQLIEEIIIVIVLPEWKTDVKGLFWILRSRKPVVQYK